MLTRRETVLGGALTLLWNSCVCAQPAARRRGLGCVLAAEDAGAFLATATEAQTTFDSAERRMIAGSGNRDFDYALAQTLSRLSDTFGVLPGFCYYDDYDGPNALATSVNRLNREHGTVLFGKRYFLRYIAAQESPEVIVTAICAHEFGHIVQFRRNIMARLNAGRPDVKRSELHADFLAGYFAGRRKLEKPDYPAAVFATNRYARGDTVMDKNHHGTPEERAAAVVRGYETAYRERHSFSDAVEIGENYVSRV
jgi:hypothetical protein